MTGTTGIAPNGGPSGWTLLQKIKAAFLGLSLGAVLATHLPGIPFPLLAAGHGLANLIGQEHGWRMFSADPPGPSIDMFASLVDTRGDSSIWKIDRQRPGGDLAHYHWIKWTETAVLYPEEANLSGFINWLSNESEESLSEIVVYGQISWRQEPPLPETERQAIVLARAPDDS